MIFVFNYITDYILIVSCYVFVKINQTEFYSISLFGMDVLGFETGSSTYVVYIFFCNTKSIQLNNIIYIYMDMYVYDKIRQ